MLLSLGADLPWLTGYTAMPLERLTMLVVPSASVRPAADAPGAGAGSAPGQPGAGGVLHPALGRDRGPGGDGGGNGEELYR